MMNKKILIASLFATLMLLVPMTSAVGVSDVSLNRKIEKIEDNNTITETYDNEGCGCQVVNRYDLFRVKLLLVRLKVFTNILLLRFGFISEVAEKCHEILDVINSDSLWDFPIICGILEPIVNKMGKMAYYYFEKLKEAHGAGKFILALLYYFLVYYIVKIRWEIFLIGVNLGCWEEPHSL